MTPKIDESFPHYSKYLKEVKKVCKTIEDDIKKEFSADINIILKKATPLKGFERKLWKIRIRCSSSPYGKSKGFRVIFYYSKSLNRIFLLFVYSKSEIESPSLELLAKLYKELKQYIETYYPPSS